MDVFLKILTVVGSIGLFLFGMKLLSESLQKVAGEGIRRTMAAMTMSTPRRILTGTAITGVVQSSSAVTVMIVSFVNAGIVTLRQAIGLIMGANIGTTITAWLVCLFGFQLNIGSIAIPFAGLGFALILANREKIKAFGSMIMGFALLFLALDILQTTVETLLDSTMISELIRDYSMQGYLSIVIMILVGALITAIIQSSSATIALTLVLVQNQWIPLEAAVAMILGENIGTTITANLAAIVANTNAKRAAISHTIINVVGVVWILPLVPYITSGLSAMIPFPFSLALFHTLFNIANTLVLMNFVPQIAKFATRIFRTKSSSSYAESNRHLQMLNSGILSTAEISIAQSETEIANQAKRLLKMFGFVRRLVVESDDREFEQLYERIVKYEQVADRVENELISYLAELLRSDLSSRMVINVRGMFRVVAGLESIANSNLEVARMIRDKRGKNQWFDIDQRNGMSTMLDLLEQQLYLMILSLEKPSDERFMKAEQMKNQINDMYLTMRETMVETDGCRCHTTIVYFELLNECRKIGNSSFEVVRINFNILST